MQEQTKAHSRHELQEKGFLMNDYEEIMNSLVKFRNYCKKHIEYPGCGVCDFQDFCDTNLYDTNPCPENWVFEDEIIICDDE